MDATLSEIIVISAGILTVMNLVDKIVGWIRQAKAPENEKLKAIEFQLVQHGQRLDDHERTLEKHTSFFDVYKHRLDVLENGNHLACKALLALLRHTNGESNYEEMQDIEKELNGYIWKRN